MVTIKKQREFRDQPKPVNLVNMKNYMLLTVFPISEKTPLHISEFDNHPPNLS